MTTQNDSRETKITIQLRKLLSAIEASGHAILPQSNDTLLKSIVETAARIFNAAAASILLVNEKEQVLEFKVNYGVSSRNLVGEKFPIDQGIAGYVVMSGQPVAISNVQQDARFNQDFAKSTGYVPKSILAMPLKTGERVIGVIEVLDKISADSFGIQDMELLSMFAQQAAIGIDQSQRMDQIKEALLLGMKNIALAEPNFDPKELFSALTGTNDSQVEADLLELANIFNKIGQLGSRERHACMDILKVFADYQTSVRKSFHGR